MCWRICWRFPIIINTSGSTRPSFPFPFPLASNLSFFRRLTLDTIVQESRKWVEHFFFSKWWICHLMGSAVLRCVRQAIHNCWDVSFLNKQQEWWRIQKYYGESIISIFKCQNHFSPWLHWFLAFRNRSISIWWSSPQPVFEFRLPNMIKLF